MGTEIEVASTQQLPKPNPAQSNIAAIGEVLSTMQDNALSLGLLLWHNRENCYWQEMQCETFATFCEDYCKLSYSYATRLINVALLVQRQIYTPEEVKEIGTTKMALLLPSAERPVFDIIELAKHGTVKDLKAVLKGRDEPERDGPTSLICPRCGAEIFNARWV